jgi:hypothetical protein
VVSNKIVHQVELPKLDLNFKSRVEQKPLAKATGFVCAASKTMAKTDSIPVQANEN